MTRGQKAYRAYLKTEHWAALRQQAIDRDGTQCVQCGSSKNINVHHIRYRQTFWDTLLEDLKVLCRKCHAKEHGIRTVPWMIFRDDERFSRVIFRVDQLRHDVMDGWVLRRREIRFLVLAWKAYPPEPKDTCMAFHVRNVFESYERMLKGDFT